MIGNACGIKVITARCIKWLFMVNVASIRRAVVLLAKSNPMSGINRQEAVRTEWTRRSAPSQVGLTGMGRPTSRRDRWTTFSDQTRKNRSGFFLFFLFFKSIFTPVPFDIQVQNGMPGVWAWLVFDVIYCNSMSPLPNSPRCHGE